MVLVIVISNQVYFLSKTTFLSSGFKRLWKYDGQYWTWIGGSNETGQLGNYGTLGVASSTNIPRARSESVGWIDSNNNLYLFGGFGHGDGLEQLNYN